ncbi:hypothetical protein EJB05_54152, partial [Eragrostis curvula]
TGRSRGPCATHGTGRRVTPLLVGTKELVVLEEVCVSEHLRGLLWSCWVVLSCGWCKNWLVLAAAEVGEQTVLAAAELERQQVLAAAVPEGRLPQAGHH